MYSNIKRLMDFISAIVLLLSLMPLLIIVGLFVKIQDGGSVFYIQSRIGYKKREFNLYKFRSMPVGTKQVSSEQVDQIVITSFGKFIRRLNIDELPQLFNILKGDMSFVGPRPALPLQQELIELRSKGGAYSIKPGLTGWAQVNAYDYMPVNEKAKLDVEYKEKMSFTLDIRIFFLTISYLFKKPPVY